MRDLAIALVLLVLATGGAIALDRATPAETCIAVDDAPEPAPGIRAMSQPSDSCTHLRMRDGAATQAAWVLGASAAATALGMMLHGGWRAAPVAIILLASALPALMAFLLLRWDPSCGPVESYAGDCTHPNWILAPALLAALATCVLLVVRSRR